MNRRWMRIMIGVFVALALVLLGTLIVLFNSLPRLFRPTTTYTAQFTDDVSGLTPGAPVRRSGVQVGDGRRHHAGRRDRRRPRPPGARPAVRHPQGRAGDAGVQPAGRRRGHRSGDRAAAGGPGARHDAGVAGDGAARRPRRQLQPARRPGLGSGADDAGDAQRHSQVDAADREDDAAGGGHLPRVPRPRPQAQQRRAGPAPDQRRHRQAGAVGQQGDGTGPGRHSAHHARRRRRGRRRPRLPEGQRARRKSAPAEPGPDHAVDRPPQRGADTHGRAAQRRQRPQRDGHHPQRAAPPARRSPT